LLSRLSNDLYIISYGKTPTPIGMFVLADEDAPFSNTLKFKKLTYVYVDESFRGLGLGKKILETAKQLAKKQRAIIILDTLHPNLNEFYKKQGAKEIWEGESLGCPTTVFGIFLERSSSNNAL
jgi:diamine N-acetyltransferase